MTGDQGIAVIPVSQLRDLIRDAVEEALASRPIPSHSVPSRPADEWLSAPAGAKRYKMAKRNWIQLIRLGKLPACQRSLRGGRVGYFVRAADAERILAPRSL